VAALELDHRPSSHEAVAGDLMPSRSYPKNLRQNRIFDISHFRVSSIILEC
jgi:hypothetical protein